MACGHMSKVSRRTALCGLGVSLLSLARPTRSVEGPVPILDTHVHFPRSPRDEIYDLDPAVVLSEMDRFGIEEVILSPPPFPPGRRPPSVDELRAVTRKQPRIAFAAGGESLNPILQATPADQVSPQIMRRFTEIAEHIAATGAASFGELAAEHFSSGRGRHPYESSPPDHPLLLALADLAARYAMPVDLHMEAVPEDMSFPVYRPRGPNPDRIFANIARFERLLDHNPQAHIVWLHAGWDLTGERTIALMRRLLTQHDNLMMSIKYDATGSKSTAPFLPDGNDLRLGWIAMLRDFPHRFMIGSDQFIGELAERFESARRLIEALPPDLKSAVASENARRIYRLA
jgi:predicted TIM-barrel fold metal-dependent hydrolase